jgi:capsular polysaccharide transport system permease protein
MALVEEIKKKLALAETRRPLADGVTGGLTETREGVWGMPPRTSSRARFLWPLASIAIPTLVAAVYFLLIASGEYVSEFRAVIKPGDQSALEGGAPVSGGGNLISGLIVLQSNVVVQYIKSADMVAALQKRLDLRSRYATPQADIFSRLSADESQEKFVKYWNGKVNPFFDMTTGTISVQVRAYTPQDAQTIAQGVIGESERLVNDMAHRSQADAIRSANEEVGQAQNSLRKARQDLVDFQAKQKSVSPKQEAQNSLELIGKLEEQRGQAESALSLYRSAPDAPAAIVLKSRIASIDAQLATIRTSLTAQDRSAQNTSLGERLVNFDALDAQREAAERYYDTALAGLERARYEASRQSTFLEVFVKPGLPEETSYPKRLEDILLTFLAGCGLWLFGVVLYQSVRDHL